MGVGGPSDVLVFETLSGIEISIKAGIDYKKDVTSIDIQFSVPEGHTLTLANNHFQLLDFEDNSIYELKAIKINHSVFKPVEMYGTYDGTLTDPLSPSDTMVGKTIQAKTVFGAYDIHKPYHVYFDQLYNLPDEFKVQFPELVIDGKLTKLKSVAFRKKTWVYAYALNC